MVVGQGQGGEGIEEILVRICHEGVISVMDEGNKGEKTNSKTYKNKDLYGLTESSRQTCSGDFSLAMCKSTNPI